MDNKITDGDTELNKKGLPMEITGIDECIQQAFIRLTVKKGSFPYNRDLGSRLHTLGPVAEKNQLLAYAGEALSGSGIYAEDVEILENVFIFSLSTPFGKGEVKIAAGEESKDING